MTSGGLRLAVPGATGRVGRLVVELAGQEPGIAEVRTLARTDIDRMAGCDVLVDFTRPEASMAWLEACVRHRVNAVIGTTGFTASQQATIADCARLIAIVLAPNTGIGVNVAAKLVELAARTLGHDADIEVFEAHHRRKVDAPSGTALMLGETAARARGQTLDEAGIYSRHGHTGEREPGSIGFSVVRAGDIVGEHTVYFALEGERIEITHRSASRHTYAKGALRAARFLQGRTSGLYTMSDVLGLA